MSIPQKQLLSFAEVCVALGHADGDVDPRELAALEMALRDLGMSRGAAQGAVADAVRALGVDPSTSERLLLAACRRVPAKLRATLFETAAHVVLADGKLGDAECLRLAALRGMLGVPEPLAIAVIASAANARPRLECVLTKAVGA